MHSHDHTASDGCSECPMTDCRGKTGASTDAGLTGWAFALSSVGVFMVPLITGVACAVVAGGSDVRRFLFGSAGLVCGMAVSAATYKIFSQSSSKKETHS